MPRKTSEKSTDQEIGNWRFGTAILDILREPGQIDTTFHEHVPSKV